MVCEVCEIEKSIFGEFARLDVNLMCVEISIYDI